MTIPALTLEDADTSLFFLSANSILFSSLTDDPWYSAHQLSAVITGTSVAGSGEFKAYNADSAAVAVGCTSQYQACNPNKPTDTGCSPYLGQQQLSLWSNTSDAKALWGNNAQKELFMTAHEMLSNQITNLQGVPTVGSLTSLNSMNGGVQPALPTNQWQLEFENWFNIYLTSLQGAFINQANGPQGGPDFEQFLWRPAKGVDEEADSFDIMCKNQVDLHPHSKGLSILELTMRCQKIISTNYTSFSTLGLVLVFTIGGLFIILSFCLEPLVFWVVRKWKLGYSYALFEWSMNETLQLQSAMHEELGLGTWTRELGGVPVTKPGERLAIVDGRDMKRPRFAAPTPALGASTTFIDEKFNEK